MCLRRIRSTAARAAVLAAATGAGLVLLAPVQADEFPKRKPGLWEMKTTGGPVGPQTVQQCIDAATDDMLRTQSNAGEKCTKPIVERSGSNYKVRSSCSSEGVNARSTAISRSLHHFLAPLFSGSLQLRGDVDQLELDALAGLVPDDRLHADQVDDALELLFRADRDLQRNRVGAQARTHLLVNLEEVGADAVHLVDERKPRHLVLVGLAPDRLRLGLHPTDRAVDHAGPVQHPHRALDLDGEVHVSRRVDDVDVVLGIGLVHALPEAGGRRGGDGDATLLLLLHPVHGGGAIMHLTDLVIDAGIEQDALGRRGLAGVDVSRNANVPVALDRCLASHDSVLHKHNNALTFNNRGSTPTPDDNLVGSA